jgi:DNA-binding response OmpR family regulator
MDEPRAKILVVDDEAKNVKLLEALLIPRGYQVVTAYNGEEALRQVQQEQPDLILLDVMMPILDGFEVCKRLKDNDETRLIPIVIMTALGQVEDRIKGIEAGADDFLTKPVHREELMARIRTSLRLKQTIERKVTALQGVQEYLAKFVPQSVKRLIAENPAAPELAKRERDVSVLFLDISGYTRLSEQLPPEALNTLVEQYFSTFLDRLHEAGGDINETAGDGFMAIFQDTNRYLHAIKAIDTALALLTATETLNQGNSEHPLAIHIGLNSGPVFIGATRFEGLRNTRWTFTASGPVTNLAARLAGVAEAGQLLIGPETVRRLGDRYHLASLGHKHLKNIADAVEIHRVLGLSSGTC